MQADRPSHSEAPEDAHPDGMRQTHAERKLLRRNAVLQATRKISHLVFHEQSQREALQSICNALVEVWDRGAAILLTDESGAAIAFSYAGPASHAVDRASPQNSPTGWSEALVTDGVLIVDSGRPESAIPGRPWSEGEDLMLARIANAGRIRGVVAVVVSAGIASDAEEQRLLSEVVSDIKLSLQGIQFKKARRQAEIDLQKSEQRFNVIASSIPGAVFRTANDNHYTLQYISQGIEAIVGYSASELMQTRNFSSIIYPEDRDIVRRAIDEGVARRRSYSVEYRLVHRDGSLRWVNEQGQPVLTDDGRYSHLDGVIVDITRLKELHDEQRQAAERVRAQAQIIDQVAEAVIAVDLHGRIMGWNRSAERLHGYTAQEIIGQPVLTLHPAEWHGFVQEHTRILFEKHSHQVEVEALHKSGRRFWIQLGLSLLHGADGEAIGTIGTASDITERRRKEQHLREMEERFRAAFETSPDCMTIDRLDGTCVAANDGFEVLTGYSRVTSIGMNSTDIDFWVDSASRDDYVAQVFKHGQVNDWEVRIRRKDGQVRTVLISARLLTLNGEPHILNVVRDVTDWRVTQEDLRRKEQRFRTLFESMSEGFALHTMIYDDAGRPINYEMTDFNPAAERMLNRKREEVLGQTVTSIFDLSAPPFLEVYSQVAETGEPSSFSSYFGPVGRTFRISAFSPARGQFATVFEDITQQVEIQREKTRLEQQLKQAQKMEALGQLAGGMAHDFNNLLTVVLGHLELGQSQLTPDHPAQGSLTAIERAARQATGVTRSLLTFSRKYHGQKQPVNLCQVVAEAGGLLSRTLPGTIELQIDSNVEPPIWVNGDSTQLQQVLINLAVNARDAMPQGGVLKIQVHKVAAAGKEPSVARLTVSDTGSGMSPDALGHAFEPFFTTKPRGQGTGLGLAIVHGIIKDHAGQITAESLPGRGTTFTISLPGTEAPPITESRQPAQERRMLAVGSGSILLAEDNEAIRRLIRRGLEGEGLVVAEAADGASLMELHERQRAETRLLILDIDLPRMSGLACLNEIRRSGDMTPAIVITGSAAIELQDQSLPATKLLRKPFHIPELLNVVGEMLRTHPDNA